MNFQEALTAAAAHPMIAHIRPLLPEKHAAYSQWRGAGYYFDDYSDQTHNTVLWIRLPKHDHERALVVPSMLKQDWEVVDLKILQAEAFGRGIPGF